MKTTSQSASYRHKANGHPPAAVQYETEDGGVGDGPTAAFLHHLPDDLVHRAPQAGYADQHVTEGRLQNVAHG